MKTELTFRHHTYYLKQLIVCVLLFLFIHTAAAQTPVVTAFSPSVGGQYSVINIKGKNFSAATAVKFGGTDAAFFYSTSDSTIIAYVGDGATGSVSVTNTGGTGTLAGFTFYPPPIISSVSPNAGGYGDTMRIKGRYFVNVTNVLIGDSSALSFTTLSDTVIKAVIGNGNPGMVTVTAVGGDGSITGFDHLGPAISSFTPTNGGTGTIVKIKGVRFINANKVSFGGISASSFTVNADTLITATVGNGGPGDVLVKTPKGTATAPGFIVPIIKYFTPETGTRGTAITIGGANFTGINSVKIGDSTAADFTIVSDSVIIAIAGGGASGGITAVNGNYSATAYYFAYNTYQPAIRSFSPATAAGGSTITINGRYFTGATAVYFGNTPARSFSVLSDSIITAVVSNGSSGYVHIFNDQLSDSMAGFTYQLSQPFITSFTPVSGNIGTVVTINGTGFSSVVTDNIVYFGAVKAIVTSASPTTLTVSVPAGATYLPITVTREGLTAYAAKPFTVTFPGAMNGFSALSFADAIQLHTTGSNPKNISTGDFDGDGKTDLAIVYGANGTNNNYVSLYRNTSINGFVSFETSTPVPIGNQNILGFDIASADINGDGKLDLVALSGGDNIISILKNNSTNGSISFEEKIELVTGTSSGAAGTNPVNLTVSDFNGDGRPDIAVANYGADNFCKLSFFKNLTADAGNVVFADRQDQLITAAYGVYARDLNNDNKPDVCVGINANGIGGGTSQISLLNNTSNAGNISFQQGGNIGTVNTLKPFDIAFSDLDADGKVDIVAANGNVNTISVFKNSSNSGGLFSFGNSLEITVGVNVSGVSIADLDGDGKPDIAASGSADNTVSVLKNTSQPGIVSFAAKTDYAAGKIPQKLKAADLDGDGKPELITANSGDSSVSILKNKIGEPFKFCPPSGSIAISSNLNGSSYQWQLSTNNGAGFSDISNGSNYSGSSTNTLQLINLPSNFNGYIFRCVVNGSSSNNYKVQFVSYWTGAVSNSWSNAANWSCSAIPDGNTDVVIRKGNPVVFLNGTCRSITALPGSSVTVTPSASLIVTH